MRKNRVSQLERIIASTRHFSQISMGEGSDGKCYQVCGQWDPSDQSFQILNTETTKGTNLIQ